MNFNKELRGVLEAAEAQGWRVEPSKAGYLLFPPDQSQGIVSVHKTPSDHRAMKNLIGEMRRRGFIWPTP
jgi:hypothetical protein